MPPSAGVNSGEGISSAARNDGWRRFGSEMAQNRPQAPAQGAETKPSSPEQPRNRQVRNANPAAPDGAGWRRFSDSNSGQSANRPAPSGQQPESRSQPRPVVPESLRRESGFSDQGSRFPSRSEARGVESNPRESRAPVYRDSMRSSRPPLDLRQPIVTPRVSREAPGSYRGSVGQRSGGARAEPNAGGASRSRSGGGGQSRSSSGDRHRN